MKFLIAFMAALASLTPARAQEQPAIDPAEAGSTAAAETLTTGEDSNNRITVPVMINGQGPFQFIIDTGSERSVLSREVAQRLGLPESGKVQLVSMGGVDSVRMVKVARLGISSGRELHNITVPALPAQYLGADGLLGLDALKGQRVLIDFAAQTMRVEPGNTRSVREEPITPGMIVVRGRSRLGQLVLVDADANGEDIWVVVDTGGQNSVGNTAFRRVMTPHPPPGGYRQVELLSVVGDRVSAEYALIGRMRIGGIVMQNAAVAFVDAVPFRKFGLARKPALLLGMESLRNFRRVSIDFANREVRFLLPESMAPAGGTP